MRILVAIKRVVDYNARVRVKPDKVVRYMCSTAYATGLEAR